MYNKIQEYSDAAAQYLLTHPRNTYIDWVEQYRDELTHFTEAELHPFDIIGKITLDAVAKSTLDVIQEQLNACHAAGSNHPDKKLQLSQLQKSYAKQEAIFIYQEKLYAFVVRENIAKVIEDNQIYFLSSRASADTDFVAAQDNAFFKTHPSYFLLTTAQKKLDITQQDLQEVFWKILEHTARAKERKTVTFKRPAVQDYNLAPDCRRWLQPIFNQKPHEFFEILFTCLAPDPLARKNVLDCLAFKYRYPALNRLPAPIFVGTGGVGKTTVGELFAQIFGQQTVNWKATLNEDTMKNTGSLFSGKLLIHFDEMMTMSENSKSYCFIKDNVHCENIKIRNLHQSMTQIENATWIWFSSNRSNGQVSPIPMAGDGVTGIDRRFTPIITRMPLVNYVSTLKQLSVEDAHIWVDNMINRVMKNPTEVAKFLGEVITQSNVDNLTMYDYPRAYHGPDYDELVGCHNTQITNLADYIARYNPLFVNLGDMFDAYSLLCAADNIPNQYRKSRKSFTSDFSSALKKYFPECSYSKFNCKNGGTSTGWKLLATPGGVTTDFKLTVAGDHYKKVLFAEHEELLSHDKDILPAPIINTTPEIAFSENVIAFTQPTEQRHSNEPGTKLMELISRIQAGDLQ